MEKWLYLAVGSVLGGFARYAIADSIYKKWGPTFPIATLLINVSGCFLIGVFSVLGNHKLSLGPNGRLLLMTGFCGAFTTFSTFTLETSNLVKDQELFMGLLNILLSVILGFILFRLGNVLGRTL